MASMVKGVFSGAKTAVLTAVQRLIDEQITKRLAPYLASGDHDGEPRSDVIVNEKNDILIVNCVARPSAVDKLLAENELPFHVISASCRKIHFDIPWENLTTGDWVLTMEGLMLVIAPKEPAYWTLSDVRATPPRTGAVGAAHWQTSSRCHRRAALELAIARGSCRRV